VLLFICSARVEVQPRGKTRLWWQLFRRNARRRHTESGGTAVPFPKDDAPAHPRGRGRGERADGRGIEDPSIHGEMRAMAGRRPHSVALRREVADQQTCRHAATPQTRQLARSFLMTASPGAQHEASSQKIGLNLTQRREEGGEGRRDFACRWPERTSRLRSPGGRPRAASWAPDCGGFRHLEHGRPQRD
jgi:hypothetical protein